MTIPEKVPQMKRAKEKREETVIKDLIRRAQFRTIYLNHLLSETKSLQLLNKIKL
jgi:hypothetical protein